MSKKKNRKQRRQEKFDPNVQEYFSRQSQLKKEQTVSVLSEQNSTNKKAKTTRVNKDNDNIFIKIKNYFKGIAAELKKVNWLSTNQLLKSTGAVFCAVAFCTAITFAEDTGFGALAQFLMQK